MNYPIIPPNGPRETCSPEQVYFSLGGGGRRKGGKQGRNALSSLPHFSCPFIPTLLKIHLPHRLPNGGYLTEFHCILWWFSFILITSLLKNALTWLGKMRCWSAGFLTHLGWGAIPLPKCLCPFCRKAGGSHLGRWLSGRHTGASPA